MNEYILKSMRYIDNPDLFTSEEMESNATDSGGYLANAAANASHAAAHAAASRIASAFDAATSRTATYAARATATAAAIDRFFKITGEDKENYNDEVGRLKNE